MSDGTVYLVDDDVSVLTSLARRLRAEGWTVQAFESAQAFLDAVPADAAGCLVLDVSMPGMDGPALQRTLAERGSMLGVVFLTAHGDVGTGVSAMKAGAVDFLVKPVVGATLAEAVGAAMARSREAAQAAAERESIRRRLRTLTPREREVMNLVVAGHLNKQIAAELGTVEQTVKMHRARVMEKMKARSLAELVRLAERAGLT